MLRIPSRGPSTQEIEVLDDHTTALLEAGSALIVGTVSPDGHPHATRGWGLDVISTDPRRVRLLLDASADEAISHLAPGRPVAVTAADVVSLRSVQIKGTSLGVGPAGEGDGERARRFADAFFDDIVATDGTPREVLERLVPDEYRPVTIDVADVFDQTPGPDAGRSVSAR
jgi:hypothetical protein